MTIQLNWKTPTKIVRWHNWVEQAVKKIVIFPDGVTEKQIRPVWWTPWANTTLYLPLNWDITDPYNQVTYNWVWTSSFSTWSTGIQAANFTWSNAINLWASTDFEQWTGEMTVLFWFTSNLSWQQRCEFHNNGKYFMGFRINSSKLGFYCNNSSSANQWEDGTTTLTSWTKYLATLTMKENWQAILYLNWNVEKTINIWTFTTSTFQFWQHIGSWRQWDSEFWRWMIKDFIIENKIRTVDEITNYHNQTK